MQGIFLINDEFKSNKELILHFSKQYKKLTFYQIIATPQKIQDNNCFYSFENEEQAVKAYDENYFFEKLIQDFENLKKEYDFILSFGVLKFGILGALELNTSIAKHLNLPIIINMQNENMAIKYLNTHFKDNFYTQKTLHKIKACDFKTPLRFEYELIKKAKADKKTIVFPESEDERILKASAILLEKKAVNIILLGEEKELLERLKALKLKLDGVQILNPKDSIYHEELTQALYESRKSKGMSLEEAKKLVCDRNYYATLLIHTNKADAMVSGALTTTAQTIRPALQIIKTKEEASFVSGVFFMCLEDKVLVFADCAVMPSPTPQQLAQLAHISACTAENFGIEAKVALLSYSSGDSGSGECVDKIKQALEHAKNTYTNLNIEGPIQFDAAYDLKTAKNKMPNSNVAGKASVYIFPDLNAANICYKAVQRTANAIAIGPILQGLKKPVNDLSRGALVKDIVNTAILSAIQAQQKDK